MEDVAIHEGIEQLVAEEQALYARGAKDPLTGAELQRLNAINVSLDQCWDLLRQRRALREVGGDATTAEARDPAVVEHYEQ